MLYSIVKDGRVVHFAFDLPSMATFYIWRNGHSDYGLLM